MRTLYNKIHFKTKGWEREEQFNYYKSFSQPFIQVHAELDITPLYHYAKWERLPISLAYLHAATQAIRSVENFLLRFEGNEVVKYKAVDATTTILKENKTVSFVHLPYHPNLHTFCQSASEVIAAAKKSNKLFYGYNGPDLIQTTLLPWSEFNSIEPAQLNDTSDATPKLTFGRLEWRGKQAILPISVRAHQALADAYHIHLFLESMKSSIEAACSSDKASRQQETAKVLKVYKLLQFLKHRLLKDNTTYNNWLSW